MAIEYLRPTADATANILVGYTSGTNVVSSVMSAVYTGKSGVGPTVSSALASTWSSGDSVLAANILVRHLANFNRPTKTYSI